ncbi:HNH endonuclease [Marinomonas gallaica]|uniref:HNH endonuclease n=1 Tax=Marinomonas gallaica TaxID=1806667 RepID=UPI001B8BEA44|nr:HNH endonuclease [Marinomonas gallaica]
MYSFIENYEGCLVSFLEENSELAKEMGLNQEQIDFFMKPKANGKAPPDLTWHHHQDTGRLQLLSRDEHQAFVPHTGGMSIWGGGY